MIKKYIGVVQNYEPDHLAILGELTGACSYKAGCGIRNNQQLANNIYNNKIIKNGRNGRRKKINIKRAYRKAHDKDKKLVTQALSLLENKKKELIDVIVNANPKWDRKELENEVCIPAWENCGGYK